MTNLELVEEEISTLERKEMTYPIAEKLAWLYVVRDHMTKLNGSVEPQTGADLGEPSEFVQAFQEADYGHAMEVIDELMQTLKVMHTRLYNAVMRKLAA